MLTETQLGRLRNFRDLGGLITRGGREMRSGALFRCGCMHLWSSDEVEAIRSGLQPRTLIDLRRPDEAGRFPVPAGALEAAYLGVPFPTKPSLVRPRTLPDLGEAYVQIVKRSGPSIVKLLKTLAAAENLPAIVFCAAGKDRTGVATAILLGALDVTDEQIVADYALTGEVDPGTLGDGYAEQFAALPPSYRGSEPQTMSVLLTSLRSSHGSIRTLVTKLGLSADDLVALERALLVPALVD